MIMNNDKKWTLFKISDVFNIEHGFYNKKPEHTVKGDIPFLSSIESNNGVSDFYSLVDIENSTRTGDSNNEPLSRKLFKKDAVCITNNGSVGFAYYQDKSFTCSHDVTPIYLKNGAFNYFTAMFVCTVIMGERYRWAYGRKWRPKRMCRSTIYLPSTIDETNKIVPDWDYMENYIKSLNINLPITHNQIINNRLCFETISVKNFKLIELFNIEYGNKLDFNKQTEIPKQDGGTCFVSRDSKNNGVVGYVEPLENISTFPSGAITVPLGGSKLGTAFIQHEPFYTAQNVAVLLPKKGISDHLTERQKLYITTLIKFEAQSKYQAFGRELNTHIKKDFSIKLPVIKSSSGYDEPDWNQIETFMKSLPYGDCI